jgi:hypothetical protein
LWEEFEAMTSCLATYKYSVLGAARFFTIAAFFFFRKVF